MAKYGQVSFTIS
jgi:hypothetical protein